MPANSKDNHCHNSLTESEEALKERVGKHREALESDGKPKRSQKEDYKMRSRQSAKKQVEKQAV